MIRTRIRSTLFAIGMIAGAAVAGAIGAAIAQGQFVLAQAGNTLKPSVAGFNNQTDGLYWNTASLGLAGRVATGGGRVPAVSSCGSGAALATGSSDSAGKITVGTTASNACTLTFSAAWATAPFCVVQNKTTGAAANVYTITTTTIVWSSALADSSELFYFCIGASGG
jgi:hypothetical protein